MLSAILIHVISHTDTMLSAIQIPCYQPYRYHVISHTSHHVFCHTSHHVFSHTSPYVISHTSHHVFCHTSHHVFSHTFYHVISHTSHHVISHFMPSEELTPLGRRKEKQQHKTVSPINIFIVFAFNVSWSHAKCRNVEILQCFSLVQITSLFQLFACCRFHSPPPPPPPPTFHQHW